MNEPAQPHQPISIAIRPGIDDNVRSIVGIWGGDVRSIWIRDDVRSIDIIRRWRRSIGYRWVRAGSIEILEYSESIP